MPVTIATKILNYNNNNTEYKTIDAISPPISEGEYMPSDAGITGAHAGDVLYISAVDADGRPTEYSSTPVFHTMTVHVTNSLGDYISGVSIKIRHNVLDGEVYVADTTTDQPLSFSLPSGFSYYVEFPEAAEVGEYFDVQCLNQEGIVQHSNLVCNIIYKGLEEIKTAADIKRALDNDVDLSDFVGESITCTKGDDILVWDIVDYDSTIPQVTLMCHDAITTGIVFDTNRQAAYYAAQGLAAGNYKLRGGSAAYRYLTLTQAIPVGGQLIVDFSSANLFQTYASLSATEYIESGSTNLGDAGSDYVNHFYRCSGTTNNYAESGIRAWLNSDADVGEVVIYGQTNFSRPYVATAPGFLKDLDPEFLEVIDTASWPCNTNSVYECPDIQGGHYTTNEKYVVNDKISLPSVKELFGTDTGDDSTQFDLFVDATSEDLIRYSPNGQPQAYWLRTPIANWSNRTNQVSENGELNEGAYGAFNAVVPVVKIGSLTS